MRTFVLQSSLIRRILWIAATLFLVLAAGLVATLLTDRSLVRGLQEVNLANQILDLAGQSEAALETAARSLHQLPAATQLDDAVAVYRVNQSQAIGAIERALQLERTEASRGVRQQLLDARDRLVDLERVTEALFNELRESRPAARVQRARNDLLVTDQLALEARELLRKAEIQAKGAGDAAFAQVYSRRNLPVGIAVGLGVFLLAMVALGVLPIGRYLIQALNQLLVATDTVASGRLDYRARILRADELGKLTHAFNRMVETLQANEAEERRHAEEERRRLEFLSRSAEEMARSLELPETLDRVVRAAIPYLADWAVLDLLEEDGRVRRAAAAHADPDRQELIDRMREFGPKDVASAGGVPEVLRTGRPIVLSEISPEVVRANARSREHLEVMAALGARSTLTVPIQLRGRMLGALSLASSRADRRYGEAERILAQDLARRAAYAIENARLFADAREALKVRNEFLSIASHELKTPLTPLKMQLQMLQRHARGALDRDALGEKVSRSAETADRMVSRLSRLVDDLLDVSRINAGHLQLRYEEFDLSEMARELVERYRTEFEAVQCPLALRAPGPILGCWDRLRVEQVLINLLTNALRYGERKPVDVELERSDELGIARIRVTDRGIGIAPEDRDRIFRRFERASPSTHYGGLGLGLFITSQIVELHGGRIELESELGRGSTFTAVLPLRPAAEQRESPGLSIAGCSGEGPSGASGAPSGSGISGS